MNKGTLAALGASSIVFALLATTAAAAGSRPFDQLPKVPASGAVLATHSIAGPMHVTTVGAAPAGAAAVHAGSGVTTKQESDSPRGSGAFVLLGMGVVLVGVVARQKRGFRRSGTILLR
jgi:hypothetical protein